MRAIQYADDHLLIVEYRDIQPAFAFFKEAIEVLNPRLGELGLSPFLNPNYVSFQDLGWFWRRLS